MEKVACIDPTGAPVETIDGGASTQDLMRDINAVVIIGHSRWRGIISLTGSSRHMVRRRRFSPVQTSGMKRTRDRGSSLTSFRQLSFWLLWPESSDHCEALQALPALTTASRFDLWRVRRWSRRLYNRLAEAIECISPHSWSPKHYFTIIMH